MARAQTKRVQKRPLPKPPSPMPWFFLGSSMLLGGLYAIFEGWAWAGWIVLGLAPFVSAILPMEISDFLKRKRICEHIRRDFIDDRSGESSYQDHRQFLSALHGAHGNNAQERQGYGQPEAPWGSSSSDFATVSSPTR